MKLSNRNAKRLVIYSFYDKEGKVDRYVPFFLKEIKKNCSEIFVVISGKLSSFGRKIFEELGVEFMVRNNKGFDVWAYKEAFEHYGWKKLRQYDEVILANHSLFGPVYPFSEMFEEMDKRDLDFWGIAKQNTLDYSTLETISNKDIESCEYLSSSFIAVRASLLKTTEYHRLWEKMPEINTLEEAFDIYESVFTGDFSDKGFKYDVYVDTSDLQKYTNSPLVTMSDELIINRHCPIIQIDSRTLDYSNVVKESVGNSLMYSFDYIREHTDYNTDYILEHIIRSGNISDVKNVLHFNYILPMNYVQNSPETSPSKIALMMHLYYEDQTEECLKYALSMPKGSDIYITTSNEDIQEICENWLKKSDHFGKGRIILIENRGRDVSALLIHLAPFVKMYDYVCFVHDMKYKHIKPYISGKNAMLKCFENNLGSADYVQNIISTFDSNSYLGMLMPPPPNTGAFCETIGLDKLPNYANACTLPEELDLDVSWDQCVVFPHGRMFWARSKVLKKLFEYKWKIEDFPEEPSKDNDGSVFQVIERLYGYLTQKSGFYSAWTMTDRFAKMEITNLYDGLSRANN